LRKEIVLKAKDGFGRKNKITIGGSKKHWEKAEELLKTIENLDLLYEGVSRLKIQQLIDDNKLKAWILFNGNSVWSKKRILRNLKQIMKHGTLYDGKHPSYIPIGSMLRVPSVGKTILSKYFYEFLHLCCGSIVIIAFEAGLLNILHLRISKRSSRKTSLANVSLMIFLVGKQMPG